jgi:hypothetical protein
MSWSLIKVTFSGSLEWPLYTGLTVCYIDQLSGKLEGDVTSLSESSQREVGDNREKWGDFWEKSIAINRNIVSRPR